MKSTTTNTNNSIETVSKSLESAGGDNSDIPQGKLPTAEVVHPSDGILVPPSSLSPNDVVGKPYKSMEQTEGVILDSEEWGLVTANHFKPIEHAGGENADLPQGSLPVEAMPPGGEITSRLLSPNPNGANSNPRSAEHVGDVGLDLQGGLSAAEMMHRDGIPYISPQEVAAIAAMGNDVFNHNGPYPVSSK
jgi:hypothetical protein